MCIMTRMLNATIFKHKSAASVPLTRLPHNLWRRPNEKKPIIMDGIQYEKHTGDIILSLNVTKLINQSWTPIHNRSHLTDPQLSAFI